MKATRRTMRKPSPATLAAYRKHGENLLQQAREIWMGAELLDTAVRDGIATGLAYLVHAGYDSIANSMNIDDTTAWMAFIDNATAEWFRELGFAEWFCLAAAQQFNTSRPRTLAERNIKVIHHPAGAVVYANRRRHSNVSHRVRKPKRKEAA